MRFHRQSLIPGWSQEALTGARVLVIGAGALGNEVLKNLALLGVGQVGVLDLDYVEESNLSRCVLFRHEDIGQPKAQVAARRIVELHPSTKTTVIQGNLLYDIGAGVLEEFDLVLGCVDSIAARWRLNRLARRAGVAWIDAGIDAWCGQIALFLPENSPCYECGMTDSMWQRVFERNSCLRPQVWNEERPFVPTTILLTSITAALQVQEATAFLMRNDQTSQWARLAPGERLSIRVAPYDLAVLRTRRRNSCLAHSEQPGSATPVLVDNTQTAGDLLRTAGGVALSLDWEIAQRLDCPSCATREAIRSPLWRIAPQQIPCPHCGRERLLQQTNSIARDTRLAATPLTELGVPPKAHLLLRSVQGDDFWCKIS
jgi:molybdopterin/thiamine biosynthesis adenylyltransferase